MMTLEEFNNHMNAVGKDVANISRLQKTISEQCWQQIKLALEGYLCLSENPETARHYLMARAGLVAFQDLRQYILVV